MEWEAIQAEYNRISVNYRKGKYLCIQNVCILEQKMQEHAEWFESFCQHSFWEGKNKKPTSSNTSELLKFLFIFMCGDVPDGGKHASLYKRAAIKLLSGSLPRDEIAAELEKRGGIKVVAGGKDDPKQSNSIALEGVQEMVVDSGEPSEKDRISLDSGKIDTSNLLFIRMHRLDVLDILECLESGPVNLNVRLNGEDGTGFKRIVLDDWAQL